MSSFRVQIPLAALLLLGSVLASAEGLGPGSPAPALSVKTWYKGAPVKAFQADKTYVVEFWATWCGPCKESIPHLTELAKKNKDVTFIGVSIWEDETGSNIKDFVKKMGSKMDYTVGYSGNKEGMSKTWMEAADQRGIPTAFVIKGNKVLWIGHPMELDKPLGEILTGKFDLDSYKAQFEKQTAESRFAILTESKIADIRSDVQADKIASAKSKMADFEKSYPHESGRLVGVKLQVLLKEDPKAVDARLVEMAGSRDEGTTQTLIMLAMDQLDTKGDKTFGDRIMGLIVDNAQKGDTIRYYFGAVYAMKRGDKKHAIELADRAIAELPRTDPKAYEEAKKPFEELKQEASKG